MLSNITTTNSTSMSWPCQHIKTAPHSTRKHPNDGSYHHLGLDMCPASAMSPPGHKSLPWMMNGGSRQVLSPQCMLFYFFYFYTNINFLLNIINCGTTTTTSMCQGKLFSDEEHTHIYITISSSFLLCMLLIKKEKIYSTVVLPSVASRRGQVQTQGPAGDWTWTYNLGLGLLCLDLDLDIWVWSRSGPRSARSRTSPWTV